MRQSPVFPALAHPRQLYIEGAWVDPSTASTFNIISSSTEEVAAVVAEATEPDVSRAVGAARKAFDEGPWPRLSHAERGNYLRAIATECERRADDFARGWTTESGVLYKLSSARVGAWLSGAFNYYAELAATFPFQEKHSSSGGLQGMIVREPVGVVAAIIPWNGPARLMAYKCAPALLAGCTVILKASPEAPSCAYLLAEICQHVGLPPGVLNMVTAERQASEALVRDSRVDKVTFTGSTAAGRKIASICGERIARYTLELGGKSPALVFDDYEIDSAAHTVAGGLGFLSGQVCHSLTRVIVSRSRHDKMVSALAAAVQRMRVGDPFDTNVDVGPLATARQRERVEHYIEQGAAEGASLATGGGRPKHLQRGFFVEPTVFGNVDNRSTIAQEEIFGPVLCVIPADNEAHAIALANDTLYGLNASVFTRDANRAFHVARQLRAGTVGQNGSRTDFGIAFGGFKQSGLGREGGTEGLLPFLETKTVVLDEPFQAQN
jgi:betaine-aldehyde dehydrogenase